MNETGVMGETGTRAGVVLLLSGEIVAIIQEARWMLLVIILCVIADFRYGWGESKKRYEMARASGDKVLMSRYAWRTSRALRRTGNKIVDYVVWVSLGLFTGVAVLEPLGAHYQMGGVAATILAIVCEAKSFCGHFFYLHGVRVDDGTLSGFFKAFAIAFAKRKDKDFGEALEEGLSRGHEHGNDKKEESE